MNALVSLLHLFALMPPDFCPIRVILNNNFFPSPAWRNVKGGEERWLQFLVHRAVDVRSCEYSRELVSNYRYFLFSIEKYTDFYERDWREKWSRGKIFLYKNRTRFFRFRFGCKLFLFAIIFRSMFFSLLINFIKFNLILSPRNILRVEERRETRPFRSEFGKRLRSIG